VLGLQVFRQRACGVVRLPRSQSELMVYTARCLVGVPAKWAGNGPGGLDCSGFAQYVLACAGYEPWASMFPHAMDLTANGLREHCEIHHGPAQAGDLAFYGSSQRATHVMIVTAVDEGGVPTELVGVSGARSGLVNTMVALARGAMVKIFTSVDYRSNFVEYGRCSPSSVE